MVFHFLRCPETQSRIRALTAQSCHLAAAVPPLPLLEVVFVGRWQSWMRVTSAHSALQDQLQLQPPLERVCVSSGSSTCSFLQHLAPGQQLLTAAGQM